ncbi:hypothetical protein LEMLEM_LOCUS25205, partial [Lemmus lemmus]
MWSHSLENCDSRGAEMEANGEPLLNWCGVSSFCKMGISRAGSWLRTMCMHINARGLSP